MIITFANKFTDHFSSRISQNPKLVKQFYKQSHLFTQNPKSKQLKDHQLVGKHSGKRAFSITRNIRVIYYLKSPNHAIFLDIGTHIQVYGKSKT